MIEPHPDMTPAERVAAIKAIYDTLPTMDCKGHCHTGCTGIDMSITERETIRRRHGITIHKRRPTRNTTLHHDIHAFNQLTGQPVPIKDIPRDNPTCQALNVITKRCSVYKDRPYICRVWGAMESLRCPWGCEPERYLTNEEFVRIGWYIELVGGHETNTIEEIMENQAMLATPEGKARLDKYMREHAVEDERRWYLMYFGLHPELKPDHWWGEDVGQEDESRIPEERAQGA